MTCLDAHRPAPHTRISPYNVVNNRYGIFISYLWDEPFVGAYTILGTLVECTGNSKSVSVNEIRAAHRGNEGIMVSTRMGIKM